jgi:hypothetical protein
MQVTTGRLRVVGGGARRTANAASIALIFGASQTYTFHDTFLGVPLTLHTSAQEAIRANTYWRKDPLEVDMRRYSSERRSMLILDAPAENSSIGDEWIKDLVAKTVGGDTMIKRYEAYFLTVRKTMRGVIVFAEAQGSMKARMALAAAAGALGCAHAFTDSQRDKKLQAWLDKQDADGEDGAGGGSPGGFGPGPVGGGKGGKGRAGSVRSEGGRSSIGGAASCHENY